MSHLVAAIAATMEGGRTRYSLRLLPYAAQTPPLISPALPSQARGAYVSALGGLPLFSSQTKFNSGTG